MQSCLFGRSCERSHAKTSRDQTVCLISYGSKPTSAIFLSMLFLKVHTVSGCLLPFLLPSLQCFCPFFCPCHPEVVSVQAVFFWIIRWPWWLTALLTLWRHMSWCGRVPVVVFDKMSALTNRRGCRLHLSWLKDTTVLVDFLHRFMQQHLKIEFVPVSLWFIDFWQVTVL